MISEELLKAFKIDGEYISCAPIGNGLINTTYRVTFDSGLYTIQKINNTVFKDVDGLMNNICGVTAFMSNKIAREGGNPLRETINVVPTVDGKPYYICSNGYYWRCYVYIDNAYSRDCATKPEDLYTCALAFSKFQNMLCDYPVHELVETIPNFHNTPDRCSHLMQAVRNDICGRLNEVRSEISFVMSHANELSYFTDKLASGVLPSRITHNDTKLNNVLFDSDTDEALCIIDFDTIMPGAVAYDFGDAIRSGAPTLSEDTLTPNDVKLDLERFEMFTKGFIEGAGGFLTDSEFESLVWGAKLMTFECGIRFLTDYLNGDVYFKTSRIGHNLSRARSQFALVRDMENKWYEMISIVEKYKSQVKAL